ncbi:Putative ribosome-binding factor A, mitochondrial [Eumeta japonica]|uniref:Ribosome-binding factor A, mitochondrial n=1 Tax=Eumeta variegata TaxID=151549 RepID=A0A4C1XK32_EUMVA|nr:Putative ribosome-binding factor A, mitochondrial [Eumeta japonica]
MLNPKAKRTWYQSQNLMPTVKSLSKPNNEPGKRSLRRVVVLNKLFMKHITDLLSTGSLSLEILNRGIEISKVQMMPNFQILNVYWVCKGTAEDIEIEALLNRVSGTLRHELSTLRLMGEVPHIGFIKDKLASDVVELDKRLAIADFGEDYTPTKISHVLKSEFVTSTKLSPEIKAKIKRLEESDVSTDDPIPELTNTIYGLDHDKITKRLLIARKMKHDAWDRVQEPDNVITYKAPVMRNMSIDANIDQDKQLAEFLHKRKILQDRLHKEIYSKQPEMEVYKEFQEETEDLDTEDYFDEDEYDVGLDFKHVTWIQCGISWRFLTTVANRGPGIMDVVTLSLSPRCGADGLTRQ